MITQTYEHHLELRRDKLCPFKFKTCVDVYNAVCNWHRNIEILLVTGGEGHIQYGSEELFIEAHDVIVVNSGVLHRLYSEGGMSFVYVLIDESFYAENGIEASALLFDKIIRSDRAEHLYLEAQKCFDEYKETPSQINTAKARCSTLALIIELVQNHATECKRQQKPCSSSEKYVKQALEYLGDHYADAVSLDELADICGITKYYLARVFKDYTGQTLFTYVNILRCKKAEICLSNGMTVTEAAAECGFESLSYFSRTYKKLIGHSPSGEK